MDYNPFTQECSRLHRGLERKKSEKNKLVDELSWFDSTIVSSLFYTLEGKEISRKKLQSLIDGIKLEIEKLQPKIEETKSYTKTLLNPFNWFNDNQKTYRKKLNELKIELGTNHEQLQSSQKSLSDTTSSINIINAEIKKYKNFDRKKVDDKVYKLNQEILLFEKEYRIFSDLKKNADIVLRPVIEQINGYQSSISAAKEKISKAEGFERDLTAAGNSYDRAMIHQECENTLGEGSPKKIKHQQEGLIRKLERDLEKAKKRAIHIREKTSQNIKKIIIDGNNMCYEGGRFVGFLPLIKLISELEKKYVVIIVFDSAIRAQVKANDQAIREQFNNINIHVVATKQLADETILVIASNDDSCYILSNDRFGEYMEKDVVKNNRLIRHEIVDGKVIIHDLNVNVRYI